MTTDKKDEKRNRPRVRYRVLARLEVGGQWSSAQCDNISMGGMLLKTDTPLAMGQAGKVEIVQNCGEETLCIETGFEVVRLSTTDEPGGEVGIKFTGLDPDGSIHLLNIVRYQSGGAWEGPGTADDERPSS